MTLPKRILSAAAAAACLFLTSCSGGLAKMTGQLTQNGTAYKLAAGEQAQLFVTTADGAYPPLALSASARPDGLFVVDMNDGTGAGLPPGKYKVRLEKDGTILGKVNPKLFKEGPTVEVRAGSPIYLSVDIATGVITP